MSLLRTVLGWCLGHRLPIVSGVAAVQGLRKEVIIRRDRFGIPYIQANDSCDAWFGLGFCQAQDRAFQLEGTLRVCRGTLSELVGPAGLPIDRLSRRIGFHRTAGIQYEQQSAQAQQILAAFVAGIQAGYSAGLPNKPHELALLGGQLTPWTPTDVLAFLKFTSFLLPSNWDVSLARFKVALHDGPDALLALDPVLVPFHLPQEKSPKQLLEQLQKDLSLLQSLRPSEGGSNNWVISGSRTATGKPLLASDPHLGPTIPAPWYLAHVRTEAWSVAGATFAGCPAVVIGHNEEAAWGVTAGFQYNTELFLEPTQDPNFTTHHKTIQEVIAVKGQADEVETVTLTPRGPILTPLEANQPFGIALHAVWLKPLPISGFLEAQHETNFEAFRQHFTAWPILPLNIVYADRAGTIGYQLCGQAFDRPPGTGLLPSLASLPEQPASEALIPFEKMPYLQNPACGFHATANARPYVPTDCSLWLGADFKDPYRERTIREELEKKAAGWTNTDCLLLQQNVRSMPWEQIRDTILSLSTDSDEPRLAEAFRLLHAWDGQIAANSAAATLFELLQAKLVVACAQAKAPNSWLDAIGGQVHGLLNSSLFADRRTAHLVHLILTQPPGWFTQPWPVVIRETLRQTIDLLYAQYGPGPDWWHWGDLRALHLRHTLLGKHRWFGPVFNAEPVPIGGDGNTISVAGTRPSSPTEPTHNIANLRAVFDLADWNASKLVLAGGQSGNPYSPHWDDQFRLWQRGEAVTMPWTTEQILRATTHTLQLQPKQPA